MSPSLQERFPGVQFAVKPCVAATIRPSVAPNRSRTRTGSRFSGKLRAITEYGSPNVGTEHDPPKVGRNG